MSEQTISDSQRYICEEMALVKKVEASDVSVWLSKGWEDTKAMWGVSMSYAALFLLTGVFISFGLYHMGLPYLVLPAMSGFLLVGPAIALGFYEGSRRRQEGKPFELHHAVFAIRHNSYSLLGIGVAQVFLFMVWIRLSFTLFAIAFPGISPEWGEMIARSLTMEGVYFAMMITGLGAVFASIIFVSGAFSLPMMMDRKTVLIPSMFTSLYAVTKNFKVMMLWALAVVAIMTAGFVTVFGLLIAFPLVGHATWHAYQQVVCKD